MTNIAKILKNAPKGLKLYSLVHGEVTLKGVNIEDEDNYPIEIIDNIRNDFETLTKDGKIYLESVDAECILFPSKEHKSWDNWQNVLFKVGDIVTRVIDEIPTSFIITSINKKDDKLEVIDKTGSTKTLNYICITEYSTPEEREQFMAELNANGYRWNDDTKQMEKIEQQYTHKYKVGDWIKFNDSLCEITNIEDYRYELFYYSTKDKAKIFINEVNTNAVTATEQELIDAGIKEKQFTVNSLKPFDKVLVRNYDDTKWVIDLFAFYDYSDRTYIVGGGFKCRYCIPYNDETKHLLGTNDDCPDKYKTW